MHDPCAALALTVCFLGDLRQAPRGRRAVGAHLVGLYFTRGVYFFSALTGGAASLGKLKLFFLQKVWQK